MLRQAGVLPAGFSGFAHGWRSVAHRTLGTPGLEGPVDCASEMNLAFAGKSDHFLGIPIQSTESTPRLSSLSSP
jgi:hypothetical protein